MSQGYFTVSGETENLIVSENPNGTIDAPQCEAVNEETLPLLSYAKETEETVNEVIEETVVVSENETVIDEEKQETEEKEVSILDIPTKKPSVIKDMFSGFIPKKKKVKKIKRVKIEHDKTLGKISHVRLFGGEISNRDEVEIISPFDLIPLRRMPRKSRPRKIFRL